MFKKNTNHKFILNLNTLIQKLKNERNQRIDDLNNLKIFNYPDEKPENKKVYNDSNSNNIYRTMLVKKNFSTFYKPNNNNSFTQKVFIDEKKEIIPKNSKLFSIKINKSNNNKKMIDSLCQTNLSVFDNYEEKEKEKSKKLEKFMEKEVEEESEEIEKDKKEKTRDEIFTDLNKLVFPPLFINRYKLKNLLYQEKEKENEKEDNKEIIKENNNDKISKNKIRLNNNSLSFGRRRNNVRLKNALP